MRYRLGVVGLTSLIAQAEESAIAALGPSRFEAEFKTGSS